ncbi:amidase family protein [Cenococcum geophilum 1.58]|uniref:Amidase family protein n=1 Tax=Cenococcum geophilum 1.58 TaxID=794803 RepID=A0ACC8ELF2_9PEZI|nr:amidase family protein [Cenococcum geophilum 1.58]
MDINSGAGTFGKAHLAGWIPSVTDDAPRFDPRTTSAAALQELLSSGKIKSVQILNEYYRQILAYNDYLKAVYQLAPGAITRAKELDALRASGNVLSPLHGIPVLLKDNIGTDPSFGMDNTGGNLALVGSFAAKNAPIVDRLIAAGAIILGKTTLSVSTGVRCGWSALHGQSQNPYIKGGIDMSDGVSGHSSPGGSSSGSAIAVAAGLAPMAIGTETEGSLNAPSTRHSLYTVKPTLGSVPNEGIIPISFHLDTAGPMCSTVKDTANLLTVLMANGRPDVPQGGYITAMKGADGWKELRVGVLDPEKFRYNEELQTPVPEAIEQIKETTLKGYERIKGFSKEYHYDVSLRLDNDFDYEGANSLIDLMVADFEPDLDKYLSGTQNSKVSTTKELAAWNKAHAHLVLPPEYPNQEEIERAIAFDQLSNRREKLMAHITEVGKSLPETLEKYNIDVIIGPSDSWFSRYSAATGFTLCTLPLGRIDYNGRPIGLTAIARSEVTLVTLMSAHEATFPAREPPTAFLCERT